jgi:hypothetical protein
MSNLLEIADCSKDSESVHEDAHALAGESATKRKRARKILRSPDKKVRVKGLPKNHAVILQLLCS